MAKYEVTAPNGKTYEVEGPSGATLAQAREQVLKAHPEAAQAPQTRAEAKEAGVPRKERTWGEYGQMALRGVGEVAGDLVGSAAYAVPGLSTIQHALPQGYRPSDLVNNATQTVLDKTGLAKPETPGEQTASAIGKGALAAAIPIPGAGKAALAKQIVSGALAGAGGHVASKVLPQDTWYGRLGTLGASLLGGMAPAGVSAVKNAVGAALESSRLSSGETRAARTIKAATTDVDAASRNLEQPVISSPGTRPTTAERARDTGIAGLQRDRLRTSTAISDRLNANSQARGASIDRVGGTGTPEAVRTAGRRVAARTARQEEAAAQARAAQEAQNLQAAQQAAQQDVAASHARVGPLVEQEASGQALQGQLEGGYGTAKTETTSAYNNPDRNTHVPVDLPSDIRGRLYKVVEGYYGPGAEHVPPRLNKILSDLFGNVDEAQGGVPRTTTEVAQNIDKQLADFAGETAMRGRRKEADVAQQLRDLIQRSVHAGKPQGMQAAEEAATAARRAQGAGFEEGTVGDILGREKYGRQEVHPVEAPERIVQPGGAGAVAADDLVRAIGRNPSEAQVRQQLRRMVDDGTISTRADVVKYRELAKKFPGLRDDLDAMADATALNEHIQKQTAPGPSPDRPQTEAFQKTALGKVSADGRGTSEFVDKLLVKNDGAGFSDFADSVKATGDKEALNGLRRAMADHITKERGALKLDFSGNRIPDTSKMIAALKRVQTHGEGILTPQQKQAFAMLQREMENANATTHLGKPPERIAPTDKSIPFVPAVAARTARSVLSRLGNIEHVDKLIEQAMLRPEYAAELLKRPTPERMARFRRSLGAAALGTTLGLTGSVTDTGEY